MSVEIIGDVLNQAGMEIRSEDGVEIFIQDKGTEPTEIPSTNRKNFLEGIYQNAAIAYLSSGAPECPKFTKVVCGKTNESLPDNLSGLFRESTPETTCTLAMGELEGNEFKTATVILTRKKESIVFNVMSQNMDDLIMRRIYMTHYKEGETAETVQSLEEGDLVWESYTSAVNILEHVDNWEPPESCSSCPLRILPDKEFM